MAPKSVLTQPENQLHQDKSKSHWKHAQFYDNILFYYGANKQKSLLVVVTVVVVVGGVETKEFIIWLNIKILTFMDLLIQNM